MGIILEIKQGKDGSGCIKRQQLQAHNHLKNIWSTKLALHSSQIRWFYKAQNVTVVQRSPIGGMHMIHLAHNSYDLVRNLTPKKILS